MKKLIQKLESRRNNETGATLIVAILVMMMLVGLTITAATYAVAASKNAGELREREGYRQAAEYALQDAIKSANTGNFAVNLQARNSTEFNAALAQKFTPEEANTVSDLTFNWRTQYVVFPGHEIGYYVYGIGYSESKGPESNVTLRAQFKAKIVGAASKGAAWSDVIQYKPGRNVWQWGLFAQGNLTIEDSKIYSYDSQKESRPSDITHRFTTVGSNESMVLNGDLGVAFKYLGRDSFEMTEAECTGDACDAAQTIKQDYEVTLSDSRLGSDTYSNCLASSPNYNNSILTITSASPPTATMNGKCYREVRFQGPGNINLPAGFTDTNPFTVYGKDVTFLNVSVNNTVNPLPQRMVVAAENSLTIENSQVTAYVYAKGNTCQVRDSTLYGAAACYGMNITDSLVYQDLAAKSYGVNLTGGTGMAGEYVIWTQEFVEEI